METLTPKDHAEEVALFRSEIIGALKSRQLERGELACELKEISRKRFRLPGSEKTRYFSLPTLERWYYRYRKGGLSALRPRPRKDRGHAHQLTEEQRSLLLDIRREHPSASVELILRTLIHDGRLDKEAVSAPTVRRLYLDHGLDRVAMRDGQGRRMRLSWQAERPNALWQGDVCHGPALRICGASHPLRIHALIDDASRFVVAIEAHHTEREIDMIGLLTRALRRHGAPDVLYLDNGSTYRGEILRIACERLGITLLHPRPYDAPARGKIERFWRTLRQGCLDFLGEMTSLHDVNVRLWAFIDQHYHQAPHSSLMGRSPDALFLPSEMHRKADVLTEESLRDALTVRERRRVRRDTTVSVDGTDWELDQGFLAGRIVTIGRSLLDVNDPPFIEHEGKRLLLHRVDRLKNAHRKRPLRGENNTPAMERQVSFDPPLALLDRAVGRKPMTKDNSI